MKIVFLYLFYMVISPIDILGFESNDFPTPTHNLTHWREHRRKKRYLIFATSGMAKVVTGVTYPVDLSDKRPWRQLVMLYNFHYQYGLPTKPIYWWDKWDKRNLNGNVGGLFGPTDPSAEAYQTDDAQLFLYTFAENLMSRHGEDGRECLLKAICENAQIDVHQGMYAELLHRFLRPHRNLDSYYVNAWHMGLEGVDCQYHFPKATNCLLDQYTHVREEYMGYTTVK